jgi:hypothetical protein
MDLRRLRAGEWITALAGAGLLVALFLPWYDEGAASPSGWESFAVLDVILALVGLSAAALLVVTAQQRTPAVPLAMDALVCVAGLLAVLLVLFRVLDLPGDAGAREVGLWLGLAASLGIFVGGGIAMRDERPSREGRHVDLSGSPTSPPAPIEPISPPPPPGA